MKISNREIWLIGIISLIPGMGLIVQGKRRQGVSALIVSGLLFINFFLFPFMITWYLFGVIYITQLAYAVALAITPSKDNQISPNSNFSLKIPSRFTVKKPMSEQVSKALSSILGSDEVLQTAIIGLNPKTSRYVFVGFTETQLIRAECNRSGNPFNPERIPKDDVTWVSLQLGERSSLFKIEYQGLPEILLQVPGNLREETKGFLEEFPGTWTDINFSATVQSVAAEGYRKEAFLVYIGCIIFGVAAFFLIDGFDLRLKTLFGNLIFAVCFFVAGWPQFINFVRRLKKETGITFANMVSSFSLLSTIFMWFFSLSISGPVAIGMAKLANLVA